MYLYSFYRFAWFDRVFYTDNQEFSSWDLLEAWWEFFLCLWNNIPFKELYTVTLKLENISLEVYIKNLFSENTVEFLNNIVHNCYTTYKKVIPLFIPDIEALLKKYIKKQEVPYFSGLKSYDDVYWFSEFTSKWQQLVVFPDLWLFYNTVSYNVIREVQILHWYSTNVQRSNMFWKIKKWKISNIFVTYSKIFQDWKDLRKIVVFSPHRRYYKNQQDPRYDTVELLEILAKIYKIQIEFINDYRL